ncbi:MAG: NAD(P)-binding domain-containing protein [Pseudomonadota bacterium]
MTKTIGVIGVGHLMEHVVPGLMRADAPPPILLSARNADRAARLAGKFGLEIVRENAEIVSRSDIVIMAVRPFDIEATIQGLPWEARHIVLSFAGTISRSNYEPHVNGAEIVQAMPVIAAEFGQSPTSIFPANPDVRELLSPCGPVIPFETEAAFKAASGAGAYFVWVQALVQEAIQWMTVKGVPPDTARNLIAEMTAAGALSVSQRADKPIDELIQEFCLPGSLSGQGLEILHKGNAFVPWHEALESIHKRRTSGSN